MHESAFPAQHGFNARGDVIVVSMFSGSTVQLYRRKFTGSTDYCLCLAGELFLLSISADVVSVVDVVCCYS